MKVFEIDELIELLEEGKVKPPETCSLCGGKGDELGVFIPTESFAKKLGQPVGKQRIAIYAGCSRCRAKLGQDEYLRRVELVMEADTKA
jgi:hypothetical protein